MRMSPRRAQLKPIDRIHELASEPDKALHNLRNYVVAVSRFYVELNANRRLLANLNTFLPFIERIDQIEWALEEGITSIVDCVDGNMEFDDLVDCIVDVGRDLGEFLDGAPTLFQSLPSEPEKTLEYVFEDIEELSERLWARIRIAGYELSDVLIGSVTEVAALSPQEIAPAKLPFVRRSLNRSSYP